MATTVPNPNPNPNPNPSPYPNPNQAEHADYPATLHALQIVDTLLLSGGLQPQQRAQALSLCVLLGDCEDEAVQRAATMTARLCETDATATRGDEPEGSLQQQGWHGLWENAINQVQEQFFKLRDEHSSRRSEQ